MPTQIRPLLSRIRTSTSSYLRARLAIDTRSLALFRLLLGLIVLLDILLRVRHLTYFYTNEGVVTAAHTLDGEFALSLFHLSDDPAFAAVFFLLYALVAVQFLLGWHTRIATVLLFVFVVSLHHRNPLVLNYGDRLLRLLLLWAIFLPLGERWSVDAVRRGRSPRPQVAGLASAVILCQVAGLHLANGYHKTTEGVWSNEPAVAYILGRDHTTYFFGNVLREFPTMLRAASLLWVFVLVSAWALLVLQERERTAFVALLVGFHVSMLLTRPMSIAPLVAIAGLLLFLQSTFWRDIASLTSALGIRPWYTHARERAVGLGSSLPTRSIPIGGFPRLRQGVYAGGLAVAVTIVLLAPAAVGLAGFAGDGPLPDHSDEVEALAGPAETASDALYVWQSSWGMHSSPSPTDRYYVFAAETTDGEFLDVYNDRSLDFQRPSETLSGHYESHRHRKHLAEVWRDEEGDFESALGSYVCDSWSTAHDADLAYLNVYVVIESFDRNSLTTPDERDRLFHHIASHSCTGKEPSLLEPEDGGEQFTRTGQLDSD